MHLVMIATAITFCWYLRCMYIQSPKNWAQRWQYALQSFLLPPLLLIATAIAILCMGTKGQMVGFWDGWLAYVLALGFCCWLMIKLLILTIEAFRLLQEVRSYPHVELQHLSARIVDTNDIFIAQIGFLYPELVATEGLLSLLDAPHLQAVLLHEQAHYYYRDTFWFFWLGWLRGCTNWLPKTDILYSELIALRELRADRWAANHIDSLLLAESLLQVASHSSHLLKEKGGIAENPSFYAPSYMSSKLCVSFHKLKYSSHFLERIEALLTTQSQNLSSPSFYWLWITLSLAFLPLIIVPFHRN